MTVMNCAHGLIDTLSERPRAPAVRGPRGTLSRGALAHNIERWVRLLARHGVNRGERVIIQVPNGAPFAAAATAVLARAAVPVFAEASLGDTVYQARMRHAEPAVQIVHPLVRMLQRIAPARRWLRQRDVVVPPRLAADAGGRVVWFRPMRTPTSMSASIPVTEAQPDDDAVVVFTSGSTQAPKGVRLSHTAIDHYLKNIGAITDWSAIDDVLVDHPQQVLYALRLGKTVWTTRGQRHLRAADVRAHLSAGRVQAYFGSPATWTTVLDGLPADHMFPSSLRLVLLGGAPVTRGFLQRLRQHLHAQTKVLVLYGLTEIGPACFCDAEEKLAFSGAGNYVGRPLPGVQVSIAADGEVILESPSLYSGYLHHPPREANEGLRTGDLGTLIDSGNAPALVLQGRKKDMVLRDGVNIYPALLEPLLAECADAEGPIFSDAALVGVWNARKQDEDLVLCYCPRDARLTPESVRQHVLARLEADVAPDHYVALSALPYGGRQNKLDRRRLAELAASQLGRTASAPADTPG